MHVMCVLPPGPIPFPWHCERNTVLKVCRNVSCVLQHVLSHAMGKGLDGGAFWLKNGSSSSACARRPPSLVRCLRAQANSIQPFAGYSYNKVVVYYQ